MTLVEVVVVIALMAVVMGFAMPRLVGADGLGSDQQAKTTASGALDTITSVYASDHSSTWWDKDAVDAAVNALPSGQQPDPASLPHLPPAPAVSKQAIQGTNPDLVLTPTPDQQGAYSAAHAGQPVPDSEQGTLPSTGLGVASAAAKKVGTGDSSTYWTVGVAVYAPSSNGTSGSCWLIQRAMDPPAGTPTDAYYVFDVHDNNPADTSATAPDADQCTGQLAASLTFNQVLTGQGQDPTTLPAAAGRSWSYPLSVTPTMVSTALGATG